jgi:hypothetical protein
MADSTQGWFREIQILSRTTFSQGEQVPKAIEPDFSFNLSSLDLDRMDPYRHYLSLG